MQTDPNQRTSAMEFKAFRFWSLIRMDARRLLFTALALLAFSSTGTAQVFVGPRSLVQSPNFRVFARNAQLASDVAKSAEENRKALAMHWLGRELPNWPEPCPLIVNDGQNKPASGETKYTLVGGGVANFQMTVSGTPERIVDSVLPHEITHTIMASHFSALGKPVPRWADEGACTTVEHQSERSKHDVMLVRYLSEGRGIPFATLFALKDYPPDMMPLYAQGYSLSCFLITQGGPQRFVKFLERGMESENWVAATDEFYSYPKLGKLQSAWNKWVSDGGGPVDNHTADALGVSTRAIASNAQNPNSLANNSEVRTAVAIQPISNPGPSPVQMAGGVSSSSGSYYLDQLRIQQQNSGAAIPQSVSLPAPFQTTGGGTIRR